MKIKWILSLFWIFPAWVSCSPPGTNLTMLSIVSITPEDQSADVPVNSAIQVIFSEELDAVSVTGDSFSVAGVTGSVSAFGSVATFTPSAPFFQTTSYTVTLTASIRSVSGRTFGADKNFSFTSGDEPDVFPPVITDASPAGLTSDVRTDAAIKVVFSEAVNAYTVSPYSFGLTDANGPIDGRVTAYGAAVIFTPAIPLPPRSVCTVSLTSSIRDLAGNPIAPVSWSFTTGVTEKQKVFASDLRHDSRFGTALSMDGDYAIIGAHWAGNFGQAYLYEKDGNAWKQKAILRASDEGPEAGESSDNFGWSVALQGNRAIVGAPWKNGDLDDYQYDIGAAYIFERDAAGNWIETAILHAPDTQRHDNFGLSVAMSGDYAIVGMPWEDREDGSPVSAGNAYIFERDGAGAWNLTATLDDPDPAKNDCFGFSLAIDGNRTAVGCPNKDNPADSGAVYVYERDGAGVWSRTADIRASDGQEGDSLGRSAALRGDTLVIGAQNEDGGSGDPFPGCGAVYVFERDGAGVWIQTAILRASNAQASDYFGVSVAFSGNIVIAGSPGKDGLEKYGYDCGAAYLYERHGAGDWSRIAVIRAHDAQSQDGLGFAVAISGHDALAGAWGDEGGQLDLLWDCGSAYFYEW